MIHKKPLQETKSLETQQKQFWPWTQVKRQETKGALDFLVSKKTCVFLKNGRPEALPKGLPAYIIKKVCFSEKWPAGGPAEETPYLYYKKVRFSEKWPAGGPAEGTPYLYKKVCL